MYRMSLKNRLNVQDVSENRLNVQDVSENRLNVQDGSEKSVFKLFYPPNVVVELKSVSTAVITRKLWNRKTTLRIKF